MYNFQSFDGSDDAIFVDDLLLGVEQFRIIRLGQHSEEVFTLVCAKSRI